MRPPVELGVRMWAHLDETFQHVAAENGYMRHEERAQMWGGFLAAMVGAMVKDLGLGDTKVVVAGVMSAAETIEQPERH